MSERPVLIAVIAGVFAGALFGFISARFFAPGAVLDRLAAEGLSVSELRLVDEEGGARLTVTIPGAAVAAMAGMGGGPDPVVVLSDERGDTVGALVLTPGLLNRAAGFK